jgi:hypothetical protein
MLIHGRKEMTYKIAKALGKLAKRPAIYVIPQETLDTDGWYADGKNDALHGRKCSYGSCSIAENQAAYLTGYKSV